MREKFARIAALPDNVGHAHSALRIRTAAAREDAPWEILMPFVDVSSLNITERLPGWHGRYFHSASMTFAHYDFKRGASIHEHFHVQEEVYEVVEGELEVTIEGAAEIVRPGVVAIVPSSARHSVKALTDGRAIIVDCPLRREFSA